eukprot:scaffold7375_cov268-Pinguiococcus_pyrenoidosus.AAC.59
MEHPMTLRRAFDCDGWRRQASLPLVATSSYPTCTRLLQAGAMPHPPDENSGQDRWAQPRACWPRYRACGGGEKSSQRRDQGDTQSGRCGQQHRYRSCPRRVPLAGHRSRGFAPLCRPARASQKLCAAVRPTWQWRHFGELSSGRLGRHGGRADRCVGQEDRQDRSALAGPSQAAGGARRPGGCHARREVARGVGSHCKVRLRVEGLMT